MCMQCPLKTEQGFRSPRIGFTEGCKTPCRCWESNKGPLEEQPVLLTTEPLLQSLLFLIKLQRPLSFWPYLAPLTLKGPTSKHHCHLAFRIAFLMISIWGTHSNRCTDYTPYSWLLSGSQLPPISSYRRCKPLSWTVELPGSWSPQWLSGKGVKLQLACLSDELFKTGLSSFPELPCCLSLLKFSLSEGGGYPGRKQYFRSLGELKLRRCITLLCQYYKSIRIARERRLFGLFNCIHVWGTAGIWFLWSICGLSVK